MRLPAGTVGWQHYNAAGTLDAPSKAHYLASDFDAFGEGFPNNLLLCGRIIPAMTKYGFDLGAGSDIADDMCKRCEKRHARIEETINQEDCS